MCGAAPSVKPAARPEPRVNGLTLGSYVSSAGASLTRYS